MIAKVKFALTFVIVLLSVNFVFAGTKGKIAGTVTDAESGKPLPAANVIIEGTTLGAAADKEGYYVILNVSPGTYRLTASMMGYAALTVTEVHVRIEQTTTINFKMKPTVLTGEEITVVAKRPVVQKDVSNSQINIESKTIESMPVQTVEEVLPLQAGIERGREGIIVRGGSANQTVFMVDGLSLNDERSNIPYMAVSLSSLREIQVQTGGFNAEYGNVRSGLVNIVTKEARRDRYSTTAAVRYSPPASKHFGPSIYDPYSYFNRPYMDPDVCWTGTANGAWDKYTQNQYPSFEGWNAVSERTLQDDDPTNDLTAEGAKRLYEWQHRRQGDIKKPDYVVDVGFAGPVPLIGKSLGDLRFYLSHFSEQDMFVFPLSRDSYASNHTQLKLTTDPTSSMKLTFTGLYGGTYSVSPYQWTTTPTGRILRSQSEIADLVNSSSGNSILYMPGFFSPTSVYRSILGIKLTHVLSPRIFYETIIQHNINRYNTYQMEERDTTKRYEPIPGYKVDEAPYGYWGYGVNSIDGMIMGGWMNLGRDKSVISTTALRFDLTNQINLRNQIKTGINVVYIDYDIDSGTESPSMGTWTRSQVYKVCPFRVGAYLQDKLEFQGFIANLGVRLDYSDANTKWYVLEDYDEYFKAGYGNKIETDVPTENSEPTWSLSPRLGVSHPITDNSKLYFNYGHFRSEPRSTYRFRLQRESNGLVTSIGDPNLALEKTIAYELGFAQSLLDIFLLNIAAYYKDITNQPGWIFYQNINNEVQYYEAANNNYEDIRGLEITLTKRTGRWITGFVNYTYDVHTSGYFGLTSYYQDPNKQRDYLRINPYQEKPRPTPYARANIDFHTPKNFGPALGGWNLNVLAEWRTGSYYTYNPNNIPGVVDDTQWRDWHNIDLRLSKNIRISKYDFQFFLDITNALNTKYMNWAGFSDTYDFLDYMESLHFSWEEGIEQGNDRIGSYRDWDIEYVPMRSVEDINTVESPESRALYYDQSTDTYMQYENGSWVERSDSWVKTEVLDKKAYIDMPNFKSLTFLNPRKFTVGIKINF